MTALPADAPAAPRHANALVIGSGFGGLAAAVRLGARGYRVTVLERLDTLGGRARVFQQDGFRFDAGPTIVTAPFLFEDLWALCGRRLADDVTLRPLAPFYRIRYQDGSALEWSGDEAAMRSEIERLAPWSDRAIGSSSRIFLNGVFWPRISASIYIAPQRPTPRWYPRDATHIMSFHPCRTSQRALIGTPGPSRIAASSRPNSARDCFPTWSRTL
jgi:phytoene dehydrogenase-like protein